MCKMCNNKNCRRAASDNETGVNIINITLRLILHNRFFSTLSCSCCWCTCFLPSFLFLLVVFFSFLLLWNAMTLEENDVANLFVQCDTVFECDEKDAKGKKPRQEVTEEGVVRNSKKEQRKEIPSLVSIRIECESNATAHIIAHWLVCSSHFCLIWKKGHKPKWWYMCAYVAAWALI